MFNFSVFGFPNFQSQVLRNKVIDLFCFVFLDMFQVIEIRTMEAPYFLPEHIFRDKCMYVNALHFKEGTLTWETISDDYKGVNCC